MEPKFPGADCANCPLKNKKVVPPELAKKTRKLTVVAESPGQAEEALKRPLVGASGELLINRTLKQMGLERGDLHLTNAILCRPPKTMTPKDWKQAIKCCAPRLETEIPKIGNVLALGAKALVPLVGKATIFPWRGYPLPTTIKGSEAQIYPSLHPAFVLRQPAYRVVFNEDIRRAVEGVEEWEWPPIHVHDGPEAEAALKQILAEDDWVGVDVESRKGHPATAQLRCIGIAGKHVAVSLPYDEPGEEPTKHMDLICEILRAEKIGKVYQNRAHDIQSLEANGFELHGEVFDTLDAHAIIAPQLKHNLEFMGTAHFPCPHWKTLFKVFDDRKDAFDDADPVELRIYNCKDSWMTLLLMLVFRRQLDKVHNGWALYRETMQLGNLGIKMSRAGVAVDVKELNKHHADLQNRSRDLKARFRSIAGDVNPNSTKQLRHLFYNEWDCDIRIRTDRGLPSLNKTALEAIMADEAEKPAQAARVLYELRTVEKLLSTYVEPLLENPDAS